MLCGSIQMIRCQNYAHERRSEWSHVWTVAAYVIRFDKVWLDATPCGVPRKIAPHKSRVCAHGFASAVLSAIEWESTKMPLIKIVAGFTRFPPFPARHSLPSPSPAPTFPAHISSNLHVIFACQMLIYFVVASIAADNRNKWKQSQTNFCPPETA